MKRLKSSDDLDSYGEKDVTKDWVRRDDDPGLHRSASYRGFYYKSENARKGLSSSSSRYDRSEDDRDSSRSVRKRTEFDVDSYDRRKSHDRYSDRGILSSLPRGGYGGDRIHRSESFSGPRRDFPKGFRSERGRTQREGSVSSWRRFGGGKDSDEGTRSGGIGESVRASRVASDDLGKAKSPAWSKDSGSEQSKSVEVKKSDDLPVESSTSSEMEEGELEPEAEPEGPEPEPESLPTSNPVAEDQASIGMDSNQEYNKKKAVEDGEKSFLEEKMELEKECGLEEKAEDIPSGSKEDTVGEVAHLPDCQNSSIPESTFAEDGKPRADNGSDKDEEHDRPNSNSQEEASTACATTLMPLEEKQKEDKSIDLEIKVENVDMPEQNGGTVKKNGAAVIALSLVPGDFTESLKDKGKSLALSPSHGIDAVDEGLRVEIESRDIVTCSDYDMEGPSSRGLELFLPDPVKKPETGDPSGHSKPKDEKFGFEPFELSLSLPNVLLPIGSKSNAQAPGSPSQTRSIQSFPSSFRTNSDGFTASVSFSGSQRFTHNPSCSLTHDSFDNYEKSVGSRPIFQGVDWQALSSKEHKNKEVHMYQGKISNGNGFHHQYQAPQTVSNSQPVQLHLRGVEGSSRKLVGMDRQLSFSEQLSGAQSRHINDVRSPSQSAGSHETGSLYNKDRNRVIREKNIALSHRISDQGEKEKLLVAGADFAEPIITMMVSEALHVTSRRFNEMTAQSISYIKESVRDIILNQGKQWQLSTLQKALKNRSDITLEMLLKSHRAQLEILVALKAGLQEFLQLNYDTPSSDLAEIFLNLRCRNLACRNLLPVDECDCKVCSQQKGFCSACMCLVCLKFDNASNTCSWVGCDLCLHWCHVDCGLRESYIRDGRSATGAQGTTEMQFHCVACAHPSEMFGFVKEVFQNFAKDWSAETILKELEYVRRIFCTSEDMRGKRLHEITIQLLSRLANNSDVLDVKNRIMGFLTESDSFNTSKTLVVSGKELSTRDHGEEGSNGIRGGSSQGAVWLKSFYSEKPSPSHAKIPSTSLPPAIDFDKNNSDKHKWNLDLQRTAAQREPIFDDLESIVKLKHAEAKMFQSRADDARREAEGLKRIAMAKNEKIEEEYANRITKLHLAEAEEKRKQKFEELQALERAHQEYFTMKMRMESDIKDLLLKMEATRRNFTV